MTTGPNKFLDDIAKLMTDAAGAAQGMGREAQMMFQSQLEGLLANMDIVQREEFDAVKEMAVAALDENEKLRARIEALEAKLSETAS